MTTLCKYAMNFQPDFTLRALLLGGLAGGGAGLLGNLLRQANSIVEEDQTEEEESSPLMVRKTAAENAVEGAMDGATWVAQQVNRGADKVRNLMKSPAGSEHADGVRSILTGMSNLAGFGGVHPSAASIVEAVRALTPKMVASTPTPASASPLSVLDYGVAATAAPLAFLGAWHGTRGLFQGLRKNDLKRRLKNRREAFEAALLQEAEQKEKQAGDVANRRSPEGGDLAAMAVLGAAGLSMLTAGMLTDRALDSQFPMPDKPKGSGFRPPRIVDEDETEKTASTTEANVHPMEHLLHTVLATNHADAVDLANLVKAAANGATEDLAHAMMQSREAMFELAAKHADISITNPVLKYAAVRDLAHSAVGGIAEKLAAAVFKNLAPDLCREGAEIRQFPDLEEAFEKLGGMTVQAGLVSELDPETQSTLLDSSAASEHSSDGKQRLADRWYKAKENKDEIDTVLNGQ